MGNTRVKSKLRIAGWVVGTLVPSFGAFVMIDTWLVTRQQAQPHLVLGGTTEVAYPGPCPACGGEIVVIERKQGDRWVCEQDSASLTGFDLDLSVQSRDRQWLPLPLDTTGWQLLAPSYG